MEQTFNADVIVIGAGLSGLCAARRLAERGRSVLVLESRDRVGGRTLSRSLMGEVLDLGGQWVGPQQKQILRLAAELGVRTTPQYNKGKKIIEIGDKISTYTGTIPKISLKGLVDLQWAISRIERLCKQVPLHAPQQAARAEEWAMMSVADFQNEQMWSREGRAVFNGAVRAIFAAEPSDLSMLHFLGYLQSGGGLMKLAQVKNGAQQNRIVGGAQQLSIRLAEIVQGHGQRLLLNALVHKICQESVGVRVESSAGSFRTHKLIVAIPPTLAKEIEFQPPLPEAHQKLLDGFVMGAVIKVIAIYPTPFWRQAGLSGEILSHSNALRLAFDASPTADSPADASPERNFLGKFGAIVGFLLGDSARQWSQRSEEALQAMVVGELVRYLGMRAATPSAFLQQNWITERWSGGGYAAYTPPGVLQMHGASLRQPCGDIHWAGTETAIHGMGYMDGAVEAGERVANEILD